MSTEKRYLFLNFHGAFRGIEDKRIQDSHLKTGLFFFDIAHGYTLDPIAVAKEIDEPSYWVEMEAQGEYEKGRATQKILTDAIRIAERESRAMFKIMRFGMNQWGRLNRLLRVNGFPQLVLPPIDERGEQSLVIMKINGRRLMSDGVYWSFHPKLIREGVTRRVVFNPDGYTDEFAEKLIEEQLGDLVKPFRWGW